MAKCIVFCAGGFSQLAQKIEKDDVVIAADGGYRHAQKLGITPDMILRVVCEHYDVRASNIISRKKNASLVIPRQVIMYICREYTDATLENIAKLLGKKDHSTVMYGVDKIKNEMVTNGELRGNVEVILKKLNINQN